MAGKQNLILDLSFEFAVDIMTFSEKLEENKKFVIASQILRSGTSIGANVREAQGCESKADFVHKMKLAAKEAEETEYWLLLCQAKKTYPFEEELLAKVNSIGKILSRIVSTAKNSK